MGLGGGILVGRLVQFLLASAFWIGRIDVPFLSNDVRFGGYHFDTSPTSYRKDILLHDTHRHPFMLRLGSMYLMKLAYGKAFSDPAGTCWRNLFVVALMPWIKRYRVSQTVNDDVDDDDEYEVWVKEKSTLGLMPPQDDDEPNSPLAEDTTYLTAAGNVVVAGLEGVKGALNTAAEITIDGYEVAPEDTKKSN